MQSKVYTLRYSPSYISVLILCIIFRAIGYFVIYMLSVSHHQNGSNLQTVSYLWFCFHVTSHQFNSLLITA